MGERQAAVSVPRYGIAWGQKPAVKQPGYAHAVPHTGTNGHFQLHLREPPPCHLSGGGPGASFSGELRGDRDAACVWCTWPPDGSVRREHASPLAKQERRAGRSVLTLTWRPKAESSLRSSPLTAQSSWVQSDLRYPRTRQS